MPETCSPLPGSMVCPKETVKYPEAGGFTCYRPYEIAPFLERCGAK